MKKSNYVDFEQECTFMEFAEQMLENTSADGMLYLYNWYDVFCEDLVSTNDFCAKVRWTREQLKEQHTQYMILLDILKELSNHWDELYGKYDYETAKKILPEWFPISRGSFFMEPLNENTLNDLSVVFGRKGAELCGERFVVHAQRLCKLYNLRAPKAVIRNECKHVFASMAICNYAEEFVKIDNKGERKMKIGEYYFEYVETIEPISQGENGEIEYPIHPRLRYSNKNGLLENDYGKLPFCKFKLQKAEAVSGVYAWVIQGEEKAKYIGKAKNFKTRFNSGYGIISPRNCYIGGQMTNCRMNNNVYETYKKGQKIDIYFYKTYEYDRVEKELLEKYKPDWNIQKS